MIVLIDENLGLLGAGRHSQSVLSLTLKERKVEYFVELFEDLFEGVKEIPSHINEGHSVLQNTSPLRAFSSSLSLSLSLSLFLTPHVCMHMCAHVYL
jgi:hypothetical protein